MKHPRPKGLLRRGASAQSDSPRLAIHRRAQALLDRSAEPAGPARTSEIEELERVYRLLEISRKTSTHLAARIVGIILLVVPVFVFLLMAVHVSTTEIDLDVTTTDASFRFAERYAVTIPLKAKALALRGIHNAHCPTFPKLGPSMVTNGVIIATPADAKSQLELNALQHGGGDATFAMASTDVPYQLKLTVASVPAENAQFTASGPIHFTGITDPVVFTSETMTATGMPGRDLGIEVTMDDGHIGNLVTPALAVHALSFARADNESTTGQRRVFGRSGVVEGTLTLNELTAKTIRLGEGEHIEFDCAEGEMRRVELRSNGLLVRFHGSVCGLRAGHNEYRRNLMPTWFEWLQARQPLIALWAAATGWLFGLAMLLLSWWRAPS